MQTAPSGRLQNTPPGPFAGDDSLTVGTDGMAETGAGYIPENNAGTILSFRPHFRFRDLFLERRFLHTLSYSFIHDWF